MLIKGKQIGYIQYYYLKDVANYSLQEVDYNGMVGLDYFIGDKDYIHKRYGSKILTKFIKNILWKNSEINGCMEDPDSNNVHAIKVNEKVDFKFVTSLKVDGKTQSIMWIKK